MESSGANNSRSLDEELNDAAQAFDVVLCRDLIQRGANPNRVFNSNSNGWYSGDSSTCLYNAIDNFNGGSPENQEHYVDTVELLL